MRVLVAGSAEPRMEILQSFLWDHGHEAELAGNGLECLTVLRAFSPEVLILDHDLLWGGGDGVLAHMGEDPELSRVPVILIADDDLSHRVGAHVVAWLKKPFRLSDLLARIDSIGRSATSSSRARFDVSTLRRPMSARF